MNALNILGIRGIPAAHGGFETFAARFAPFMRDHGWAVTVYCQGAEGVGSPRSWADEWEGIRRVHFETRTRGAMATIEFDLRCVVHVLGQPGVDLVLGYNTAIFNVLQRLVGRRVVINMDGIEWKRQKWGTFARLWFWINELIGSKIASVAIADHPKIAEHLQARGCRNPVVIPYASDLIRDASTEPLESLGLKPSRYFISIARIEPENSVLEMIRAFGSVETGCKFVVLGKLDPKANPYHALVMEAAGENVVFPGAIYDREIVRSLRRHCLAHMHGHQVGGTNPSLVEALGAGNAVIAHDNPFNRWTAGPGQLYFSTEAECAAAMVQLATNADHVLKMQAASHDRHHQDFQFDKIHEAYLRVVDITTDEDLPSSSGETIEKNNIVAL